MVLLSRKLIEHGQGTGFRGFYLDQNLVDFPEADIRQALTVQSLKVGKPLFPLSVFLPKYAEQIASQ